MKYCCINTIKICLVVEWIQIKKRVLQTWYIFTACPLLEVPDGEVIFLRNDKHRPNVNLPGEVVQIVCNDNFIFYDQDADYVYECLDGGTWNNSAVAICMKGQKLCWYFFYINSNYFDKLLLLKLFFKHNKTVKLNFANNRMRWPAEHRKLPSGILLQRCC